MTFFPIAVVLAMVFTAGRLGRDALRPLAFMWSHGHRAQAVKVAALVTVAAALAVVCVLRSNDVVVAVVAWLAAVVPAAAALILAHPFEDAARTHNEDRAVHRAARVRAWNSRWS